MRFNVTEKLRHEIAAQYEFEGPPLGTVAEGVSMPGWWGVFKSFLASAEDEGKRQGLLLYADTYANYRFMPDTLELSEINENFIILDKALSQDIVNANFFLPEYREKITSQEGLAPADISTEENSATGDPDAARAEEFALRLKTQFVRFFVYDVFDQIEAWYAAFVEEVGRAVGTQGRDYDESEGKGKERAGRDSRWGRDDKHGDLEGEKEDERREKSQLSVSTEQPRVDFAIFSAAGKRTNFSFSSPEKFLQAIASWSILDFAMRNNLRSSLEEGLNNLRAAGTRGVEVISHNEASWAAAFTADGLLVWCQLYSADRAKNASILEELTAAKAKERKAKCYYIQFGECVILSRDREFFIQHHYFPTLVLWALHGVASMDPDLDESAITSILSDNLSEIERVPVWGWGNDYFRVTSPPGSTADPSMIRAMIEQVHAGRRIEGLEGQEGPKAHPEAPEALLAGSAVPSGEPRGGPYGGSRSFGREDEEDDVESFFAGSLDSNQNVRDDDYLTIYGSSRKISTEVEFSIVTHERKEKAYWHFSNINKFLRELDELGLQSSLEEPKGILLEKLDEPWIPKDGSSEVFIGGFSGCELYVTVDETKDPSQLKLSCRLARRNDISLLSELTSSGTCRYIQFGDCVVFGDSDAEFRDDFATMVRLGSFAKGKYFKNASFPEYDQRYVGTIERISRWIGRRRDFFRVKPPENSENDEFGFIQGLIQSIHGRDRVVEKVK